MLRKLKQTKVIRKVSALLVVSMLFVALSSTNVFAANEYGPGEWYLGQFTFQDSNAGARRTYNAEYMQIKIAWKPGEWGITFPSDIDLYVGVQRIWNGETPFQRRLTPADDTDGKKDANGYYYYVSPVFKINKGSDYRINYEAFTAAGQQGTGNNRYGDVHTWIVLSN